MKRAKLAIAILGTSLLVGQSTTRAQTPVGTAFTYQGQLKQAGTPVNGLADFEFALWDAESGGSHVGWAVQVGEVDVVDSLFTVQLDFGSSAFNGEARWLEIGVTYPSGGGDPTTLSPRQPLTGAPYALYALSSPGGAGFWAANGDDIYNTNSGQVGIGTTSPNRPLHVESDDADAVYGESSVSGGVGVYGKSSSFEGGGLGVRGDSYGPTGFGVFGIAAMSTGNNFGVYGQSQSQTGRGVYGLANSGTGVNYGVYGHTNSPDGWAGYFTGRGYFSGNVGIGTSSPDTRLHIDGGFDAEPDAGGYLVVGALDGLNLAFDNNEIMARDDGGTSTLHLNADAGNVVVGGSTGGNLGIGVSPAARLDVAGNVIVRSESSGAVLIELGEGLDYAEGFDVSDKSQIKPGAVVVIDADNPGKLVLSTTPYDRKVAGIVAGANGLGSAVRLGAGQFDLDVALAGRVYCNVDATCGAVQAGDLLTTSPTPGYAMKVTDYNQAQGAILGKAMQPLKQGEKGQILVLVTLQ